MIFPSINNSNTCTRVPGYWVPSRKKEKMHVSSQWYKTDPWGGQMHFVSLLSMEDGMRKNEHYQTYWVTTPTLLTKLLSPVQGVKKRHDGSGNRLSGPRSGTPWNSCPDTRVPGYPGRNSYPGIFVTLPWSRVYKTYFQKGTRVPGNTCGKM